MICHPTKMAIQRSSNWFYVIRDLVSKGSLSECLLVYAQVRRERINPCVLLLPLIFKACANLSFLNYGKSLHADSIKLGADCEVMVATSLLSMYAKCGDVTTSRKVFDSTPQRNAVTWNAMISGHLKNGDSESAIHLFKQMPAPTAVTWIEIIDGVAKKKDTFTARKMFDQVPDDLKTVVTWTVMVDGYSSNGEMEAARELFEKMPKKNFFVWSSMISGYCKKGNITEAEFIFERIPSCNLVNWNSLISGYAQNGFCHEALGAFKKMQDEGFEPDEITVVSVLSACAQLGELDFGKEIHRMINHKGIKSNLFVLNALLDMYAKCGDLANARMIVEGMDVKNVVCWNAMISGFAIHGQFEEALEFFNFMENSSEKPDDITFLSVLSACAHGGLVDEAVKTFSKMEKYGLVAGIKHFSCLVDLLGRAGRLKDAYELTKRMHMAQTEVVLRPLLGACWIHLDLDLMELIMKETRCDDSCYVLLAGILASSERWEKAERMRRIIENEKILKIPGCSSVISCESCKI